MRAKTRDEGGWVLITAAVLMGVMLSLGLVALRLVDSDSHRSRNTRESESALNLDEGVLYAQSLILAQGWPSAANHPNVVASCSSATATQAAYVNACPNPGNLAGSASSANFKNVDQLQGSTWKTKIRDNDGALKNAYDPTKSDLAQTGTKGTCASPCNYDFNGDDKVWVQAQTYVKGHPRNVVALMQLETLRESIPRSAVTAGALSVTNNGNHGGTPIIDATGSQVVVRCATGSTGCVQADSGQVTPWPPQTGTTSLPPMMTATQLARFKARAITDGHYFPGCPTKNANNKYDLNGAVVWVEGCSSPPNLTNSVVTSACSPPNGMSATCVNSVNSPGILIWHCGRADFQGGFTYRGVLYIVNNSDGTCPASLPQRGSYQCSNQPSVDNANDVLNTNGGFGVWGAVAVDGPGCLKVGSNNLQITFDPRVFDSVESYGTVGLVQNTWRELAPNAF
jgi:Tfp pilus assembly protein PilX